MLGISEVRRHRFRLEVIAGGLDGKDIIEAIRVDDIVRNIRDHAENVRRHPSRRCSARPPVPPDTRPR